METIGGLSESSSAVAVVCRDEINEHECLTSKSLLAFAYLRVTWHLTFLSKFQISKAERQIA